MRQFSSVLALSGDKYTCQGVVIHPFDWTGESAVTKRNDQLSNGRGVNYAHCAPTGLASSERNYVIKREVHYCLQGGCELSLAHWRHRSSRKSRP